MPNRAVAIAAGGLALVMGLGACSAAGSQTEGVPNAEGVPIAEEGPIGSTPEPTSSSSVPSPTSDTGDSEVATSPGSYITYSDFVNNPGKYQGTETVLFFNAKWCLSCVAADASITESGVPSGMTIVAVDFDSSQELKQKYGVTIQHTFVQLGEQGQELTKFTGSITVEEIKEQLV